MKFLLSLFILLCIYFAATSFDKEQPPALEEKKPTTVSKKSLSDFPKEDRVPGGLVKLRFKHKPELFIGDKKVQVFMKRKKQTGWFYFLFPSTRGPG